MLSLEIGAYPHPGMRAKFGKLFSPLLMKPYRAACRMWREVWGTQHREALYYQADRKLCHSIAAKYRQSGRSHWWTKRGATRICDAARLKEILERSLKSNTPTSVHLIAASLGYSNEGYIHQKYPELCRAIGDAPFLGKCDQRAPSANSEGPEPSPGLFEFDSPAGS